MFNDDDLLSTSAVWTAGTVYRPSRILADPSIEIDRQRLQDATTLILKVPIISSPPIDTPPAGTPAQVTSISATESPFKSNNGMKSLVSVSFVVNPSDTFFDRAQIWFTGYNGNSNPQLMSDARTSPASFLCDTTGETVTVTIVAIGTSGLTPGFIFAPHTSLLLDGVTSAPPAPSIAQTCLPFFGGVQFAFNIEAGLVADVITNYKVYRNVINDSTLANGAFVVNTVPQNAQSAGTTYVFQDSNIIANTNYWYWVSAVNQAGLESTLTAAGTAAASFALPSSTLNLLGNPDMIGTGDLPFWSPITPEQWSDRGSATVPDFRNGREIRLPVNSHVIHFKGLKRFEPGLAVTLSFWARRGGLVTTPTGNFSYEFNAYDAGANLVSQIASSGNIAISTLNATTYVFQRLVVNLARTSGQSYWAFKINNVSTQDDLYITKPMLNLGPDSSPYTNTTFLTDLPQFTYEGNNFWFDDCTGVVGVRQYPTPTPGAGAGSMYTVVLETGTTPIDMGAGKMVMESSLPLGVGNQTTQVAQIIPADSVAYSVQGDVTLGSGTTTILESGVMGRRTDINNFYLARLLNSSGTVSLDLFKRVAGAYTSLGTFAPGAISGGTIKLQITDAAKIVFLNGTQRISSADNSLTSIGAVGVREGYTATAITTAPSATNLQAFYIQNVAAPATPPVTPPSTAPPPTPTYDPTPEPPPILNKPRQINRL